MTLSSIDGYTLSKVYSPLNRINWVDILAVILLVRMGYVGLKSGMSAELVKLAGLVAGFFVGFRYYQQVGDSLAGGAGLRAEWASVLVMSLGVAAVYFVVTRLLRLSEKLVQVTFAKPVNEGGGALIGALRGVLVASVILTIFLQVPAPYLQASILENSWSGKVISRAAPLVYDTLAALPARMLAGMKQGTSR